MNNGAATQLLAELTERGVRLDARGGSLAYYPRAKVPRELREQLKQHKVQIISLLQTPTVEVESGSDSTAQPRRDEPTVSVVVVAPETRTLESTLLSALGQTHAPCEILVISNGQEFQQEIVSQFARHGVRQAASILEAAGRYVLLMDGRTLLTRQWIKGALEPFAESLVGVAHSDHELLSADGGQTQYPDHIDTDDLARSCLDAPTILVRRDVLVAAYEPGDSVNRLLRRIARTGWEIRKQPEPILFRGGQRAGYFDRQELAREVVTLFIPLSGREHTWRELRAFLERQTWPHDQLRVILCDTSQDREFGRLVRDWIRRSDYPDVRHFEFAPAQQGLADHSRPQSLQAVNEAMCRIYNRLRELISTDYVWVLEDDIIPPDDVLARLFRCFEENVASVSAPYRSRFDGRWIVWNRERQPAHVGVHRIERPLPDSLQVQDIRGTGFGCLLARAEVLKRHIFSLPDGELWYDVGFFRALDDRWRRRVDWSCQCDHLHNMPRPKSGIARRNLIYHITSFDTNDIWMRNVRQILKRIDLFNGRRVIAVATGEGLVPPDDVRRAFGPHEVEMLTRPNSADLRENATFLPLLERIQSDDPCEATFYAHAKGVAKDVLCLGDPKGSRYWRNAMYRELLDDWERIAELLDEYPVVGTHRRLHSEQPNIFPDGQSSSPWHFAGTFFWFRNRDVFATDRWREVWQPAGWGAEAWPGRMFDFQQSACVAYDGLSDVYNPDSYFPQIEDDDE